MKKLYFLLFAFGLLSINAMSQAIRDNFENIRKGTYGYISGTFIPYNQNPDPTGANTSLVAAEYTRNPAEQYDVIIQNGLMENLHDYVTGAKHMSIDVYSPAAGIPIQITLEDSLTSFPNNYPTGRHSVYLTQTTVANAWETLTFNFDNRPDPTVPDTTVNRVTLLFNPGTNTSDTYYFDNLNYPALKNDPCNGASPDPNMLDDFECNQNVDFIFSHSGINFRRVPNPDMNGNSSPFVATYTRNGGELNDVCIGRFTSGFQLTANSRIKMDVWDPNAPTPITFSLQTDQNDVILAMTDTTSVSGGWETLTFDPSSVYDAPGMGQFVILFNPNTNTSGHYYFDNLRVDNSSGLDKVDNVASFSVYPNPTSGNTALVYNLRQGSDLALTLTDITGKTVLSKNYTAQAPGDHRVELNTSKFANGIYFYSLRTGNKIKSGKLIISK